MVDFNGLNDCKASYVVFTREIYQVSYSYERIKFLTYLNNDFSFSFRITADIEA